MPKQQFGKQDSDISLNISSNICLEQLLHLVFTARLLLFPPFSSFCLLFSPASISTGHQQPEVMEQSPVVFGASHMSLVFAAAAS